jgi:hypothetical protein
MTPTVPVPVPVAAASPLRAVLAEIVAGAPTLDHVARRTGLGRDVVSAAVEHLVRLGRVDAEALSGHCPRDGCGGCGGCGVPSCCGAVGMPVVAGGRPVLVALRVSRRGGG